MAKIHPQKPAFRRRGRDDTPLTKDEIFSILSSQRRRYVLHHLKRTGGDATVRELTEQLAAWENGLRIDETSRQQRKRVYTALVQNHLPKMTSLDVIDYDRDRVSLSDHTADLDIYLEVTSPAELPWSDYYFGLGLLSLVFTAAVWLDAYPFSLVPDIAASVGVTLLLLTSAGIHAIRLRKKRLGSDSFLDLEQ